MAGVTVVYRTLVPNGLIQPESPRRRRRAYLPHINGEDTWQIVTVAGGRIISYTSMCHLAR